MNEKDYNAVVEIAANARHILANTDNKELALKAELVKMLCVDMAMSLHVSASKFTSDSVEKYIEKC